MTAPFDDPGEEDGGALPDSMPVHTACGLPAELCVCPDAGVKFEDGFFKPNHPTEPKEDL